VTVPDESTANQYAFLIGIDCYLPGQLPGNIRYPNLRGCVRDIAHVAEFLKNGLKVPEDQIHLLTATNQGQPEPPEPRDRWPTYETLVATFNQLTDTAQAGDCVYVHYSGHGGRTTTLAPAQKGVNGIDEALVPMDIQRPGARYLRDLELAMIFQRMAKKGIRLGVVLDCCHSGGAVRGVGDVAVRGIGTVDSTPRDPHSLVASAAELAAAWAKLTTGGTRNVALGSGWLPEPQGYALLAACRPTELAYEYAFSGTERNGALTYWLLDSLSKLGPGLSVKTLHERILAKVHSQFEQQTPQLQGDGRQSLFGLAATAAPAAATVTQIDVANGRLQLTSAGQAFGNRKGAQFAIYPLGTIDFAAAQRQAIATITEVGATDSWAVVSATLKTEPIQAGAPCVLTDQGSLKGLTKIGLARRDDLAPAIDQDTALAALGTAMADSRWIALKSAGDADTLEYQVAVNAQREYEIWDPAGQPIANLRPPIGIDAPAAPALMVSRLEHLAKYSAVKQLENHDPNSPLAGKLVVELVGYQDDYMPGDKPEPRAFEASGNTPVMPPGRWAFLRIRNDAQQPLNVTVLDLQPDWGITQVYPGGEGDWFVQLEPGSEQVLSLQASLPQSFNDGLDTLKVFATVGAANFGRLALGAIDAPAARGMAAQASATRGQRNALEELLDAVAGERPRAAARTFTAGNYPSAAWVSSLVEVHVRKA
jgi:hypothetical protein